MYSEVGPQSTHDWCETKDFFRIVFLFAVAPRNLPSYRERFMGQQHRKIAKRRRRASYLERLKAKAKAAMPARKEAPKAKAKKAAAAPPAPSAV